WRRKEGVAGRDGHSAAVWCLHGDRGDILWQLEGADVPFASGYWPKSGRLEPGNTSKRGGSFEDRGEIFARHSCWRLRRLADGVRPLPVAAVARERRPADAGAAGL